jgi:hypothetical protein
MGEVVFRSANATCVWRAENTWRGTPHSVCVIAGFGFDLSTWKVLDPCREEVGPLKDFDTATVRADLLPMLAHPFDKRDRPRVPHDKQDEWAADIARPF